MKLKGKGKVAKKVRKRNKVDLGVNKAREKAMPEKEALVTGGKEIIGHTAACANFINPFGSWSCCYECCEVGINCVSSEALETFLSYLDAIQYYIGEDVDCL